MNSRLRTAALALSALLAAASSASADIIVGLVLDPMSTAGSSLDVNSIYSGLGTWHMFALDDSDDDFGISSYNIGLTGATSFRHTSPTASAITGASGDSYDAGFNLLRSSSTAGGVTSVHASQSLPGQSPFLITGLGQQAGSFTSATGGGSATGAASSSWGNYNTISPLNGKNWLFLGEGTYDQGILPTIANASFTVYNNSTTFGSKFAPATVVPESMTNSLLTPQYLSNLRAQQAPVQPPVVPPTSPPVVNNPPVTNPPVSYPPVIPPQPGGPVVPPICNMPAQPSGPADEAIVVGMVVQPSADGSPSTWQLYAVDNNLNDYGISSYNVNISGAKTVRHASPVSRSQDGEGNSIETGFSLLRGVTGADGSYSIHAAQGLPDQGSQLTAGYGKGIGSVSTDPAVSPLNGNNWLLLAEGTYDTPAAPIISQATFTVYGDESTFASKLSPTTVIPQPLTASLLTPEYFASLTPPPRSVSVPPEAAPPSGNGQNPAQQPTVLPPIPEAPPTPDLPPTQPPSPGQLLIPPTEGPAQPSEPEQSPITLPFIPEIVEMPFIIWDPTDLVGEYNYRYTWNPTGNDWVLLRATLSETVAIIDDVRVDEDGMLIYPAYLNYTTRDSAIGSNAIDASSIVSTSIYAYASAVGQSYNASDLDDSPATPEPSTALLAAAAFTAALRLRLRRRHI